MEESKKYKHNEVYSKTLEYFNGDELATNVWISKYCLKKIDEQDNITYFELSPTDMFKRLASELYRAGLKYKNPLSYDEIYELIEDFKYVVPQGRPMAGIGNNNDVTSLSNCFVVGYPDQDSYGVISRIDQEIMQISKRGGGVGTDLSGFRASGSKVKNAAMTSTGPVEICANRFSNTIREVGQCLHENTYILTESGLKYIKNINIGDNVWTENGWTKVDNIINSRKKTYKLTTKYGNEIVASNDHIFQTMIGEKYLSEFNVGDQINMIYGKGYHTNKYIDLLSPNMEKSGNRLIEHILPKKLEENLGYLLGYMYGDGNLYRVKSKYTENMSGTEISLACASNRPEIIDKLKNIWKTIFGSELSEKQNNGNWITLKKSSQHIYEFLKINNIDKEKAGSLIFPDHIINSPLSVQLSFISGYFDADGYASDKKKGYVFTSIDKDFLLVIKNILSGNGILTKIHEENRDKQNWKKLYSLCVVGAFSKIELKNKLTESLKLDKSTLSANRDCFLSIYKAKDVLIKNYNNYSYVPDNSQFLSLNTIKRIQKDNIEIKNPNLYLYQDFILKKEEYCDDSNVYDLVLENTNLFWANGFYAHNCGRRGALMLTMDIEHPDAEKFIDAKMTEGKITGANISVKIKNNWLNSFINNIDPNKKNEKLWKKIIHNAWKSAEPGILFWDTIINESVPDCYSNFGFKTISTNPCGEITLSDKDSCRLMLLNLYSYVINPFTDNATMNYDKLRCDARKIMKLMDNMIDLELEKVDNIIKKVNSDPESESIKNVELNLWNDIKKIAMLGRRSGIGVTAEGDMLAAMGYKYGTSDATNFAANIHKIISTNVYIGSCDLTQIDNRPKFECFDWELEKNNPYINRLISYDDDDSKELSLKIKQGRRNIALLTIPPAGTTSIMTQTTSGIEPVFMPVYKRKRKIDKALNIKPDFIDSTGDWFQEYTVSHHKFIVWYSIFKNISFLEAREILNKSNESELSNIVKMSPYYEATSTDVNWIEKVKMQGEIQKFVDHSISATTNIPKETDEDTVRKIYETAWICGCKGMTIYRDGSRDGIMTTVKEKEKEKNINKSDNIVEKRPKSIIGKVVRFNNGGEKWVSVIGILKNEPYEIFTGLLDKLNIPQYVEEGKIIKNHEIVLVLDDNNKEIESNVSRYDFQYKNKDDEDIVVIGLSKIFKEEYWNYAKLISGLLRHHMPIEYIVRMISTLNLEQNINSWKNGVIRSLKKFIKDGVDIGEKCPECGGSIIRESGCFQCKECGYSKC